MDVSSPSYTYNLTGTVDSIEPSGLNQILALSGLPPIPFSIKSRIFSKSNELVRE